MKYDVDYFLKKFDAIPEDRWTIRRFRQMSVIDNTLVYKKCALSHCGTTDLYHLSKEGEALNNLVVHAFRESITNINDGNFTDNLLLGDTPRERVLNALVLVKAGVTID